MGKNNTYKSPNEKFAQILIKNTLKTISGLLLVVGRPLYLFILLFLTVILNLLSITGYVIKTIFLIKEKIQHLIFSIGIRKKSGLIFSASKEKLKVKIKSLQNFLISNKQNYNKKLAIYTLQIKDFIWKIEVFPIALQKFFSKLFIAIKTKLHPLNSSRLFFLKIRLFGEIVKNFASRLKLPKFSFLKIFTFFLLLSVIFGITGSYIFWQFILKDLPSPQELASRKQKVSTKIYDRHGTLLYNIYKDQNRTPVSLEEIPLQVRLATIAIEDAEFYAHPGFSMRGIVRALLKNYKEKKLTGGSTITQQLIKNTLLTSEKTYIRKLKELTLAVLTENTFKKDKILEMYLNEVSYGGTAYGIQEASRTYFGKDVKNLSLAEAALLAGLPKSPTEYSPFGANPELALSRQKEVLNQMEANSFITKEQHQSALNEKLKFADQKTDIKAPHFVMWVRQFLEDKYGKNTIDSGGLEITTTLDYSIQVLAEKVVNEELEKLSKLNVTNAAVVVLNPKTGEVLAMVGSKDYFDTKNDGNVNVTLRPRQPGSSIKIVNYAYALSNGMNAASIIPDTPVTFLVEGQPPYTPKNYEGNFRGNITLRSALAESRNIPAVRVLASYGVDKMLGLGQKMGLTTWQNPSDYGLSLTLGGGEVRLIDLAQAYATVANYGKKPEINPILTVKDVSGNFYEYLSCDKKENIIAVKADTQQNIYNSGNFTDSSCGGEQIIDPRVAYVLTDILKDNDARSPTFGVNSLMKITGHNEVAVKTGTSNNLRDNLTIGYNQNYLVAVWVGNNDNSPMARIASGITGATPIWNKIMTALLANENAKEWIIPENLVKLSICPYTGTLSCSGCPARKEWFLEENEPKISCSPEWFIKEDDKNAQNVSEADQDIVKEVKTEIIKIGKTKIQPINPKVIKKSKIGNN